MNFVLNVNGKVIVSSKSVKHRDSSVVKPQSSFIGHRIGEVLGCVHSDIDSEICGKSIYCKNCGLEKILSESFSSQITQEASLSLEIQSANYSKESELLNFNITTSWFEIDKKPYILVSIEDDKYLLSKQLQEKSFLHDLVNTTGGIQGLSDLLINDLDTNIQRNKDVLETMAYGIDMLLSEITKYRVSLDDDENDNSITLDSINLITLTSTLIKIYEHHSSGKGAKIVASDIPDLNIFTDEIILKRILGNMLKNALEASDDGDNVVIRISQKNDKVEFAVSNNAFIPEEYQAKIFKRNFSTKGQPMRGLGTYTMKVLGENVLGGKVDFSSTEADGTIFRLVIDIISKPISTEIRTLFLDDTKIEF